MIYGSQRVCVYIDVLPGFTFNTCSEFKAIYGLRVLREIPYYLDTERSDITLFLTVLTANGKLASDKDPEDVRIKLNGHKIGK